jgi:hypothetical protein
MALNAWQGGHFCRQSGVILVMRSYLSPDDMFSILSVVVV